jgi:hypothetical protein
MLRGLAIFAVLAGGLTTCWPWSSENELRETGETPFVRCLAAPPPAARSLASGRAQLTIVGRDLQLKAAGASPPLRLALFSAAGFAGAPGPAELTRLRAAHADVLVWVGGIGDSRTVVDATLRAMESLEQPTLLLLGGRDSWSFTHDAIVALGPAAKTIDVTGLLRIIIDSVTLVPVGGAANGRYALDETRCGFAQRDLDERTTTLGAPGPGEKRWLISWERAAAVSNGSPELTRFAARIGAVGTLGTWPGSSQVTPTALVIPRLFGPELELPDGSFAPPNLLLVEVLAGDLRPVPELSDPVQNAR